MDAFCNLGWWPGGDSNSRRRVSSASELALDHQIEKSCLFATSPNASAIFRKAHMNSPSETNPFLELDEILGAAYGYEMAAFLTSDYP